MHSKQVIFSDLDGTLLDREYSFGAAQEALEILKKQEIPLVICTSKTRAEIEVIRRKLKNKHPFISENGGAIFIPRGYFGKNFFADFISPPTRDFARSPNPPAHKRLRRLQTLVSQSRSPTQSNISLAKSLGSLRFKIKEQGNYEIIEFGMSYKKIVRVVEELKKKFKIRNFDSMSAKEIAKSSGLELKDAKLSKKREYDEVFILKNKKDEKKLMREIKKRKLNFVKGGRYFHILGDNDKGRAVLVLTELYKKKFGSVQTISFGDADNDKPMIKNTDRGFFVHGPRELNNKIIRVLGMDRKFVREANELYQASLKLLGKFQQGNGAILASFPRARYPYVYPRDHSICTLAFLEAGNLKRAKKAIEFILRTQKKDGSFAQRLNAGGRDASYKPLQVDNAALVLYCFARYIKVTNDRKFLKKYKKKINKSVRYLKSQIRKNNLFFTPNSIHEFPPIEEGLEIWTNAACYACLRELEEIGFDLHMNIRKIKKSIGKYFWNRKYFVKTIRLDESSSVVSDPDASSCAVDYFDVFEAGNVKVRKTIKEIESELLHRSLGGICRYKKSVGRNNGGWGPWPHFTLMVCRHFIKTGNQKKADKYLKWILKIALNNKLPEHLSTVRDFEEWVNDYKSAGILRHDREIMIENIRKNKLYKKGLAYSVLPLSWPHAEFVRTWLLYKDKFL